MQNWIVAEGTVDQVNGTAWTIGGCWDGCEFACNYNTATPGPIYGITSSPWSFFGCCSSGSCTPGRATGRTILSSQ